MEFICAKTLKVWKVLATELIALGADNGIQRRL